VNRRTQNYGQNSQCYKVQCPPNLQRFNDSADMVLIVTVYKNANDGAVANAVSF